MRGEWERAHGYTTQKGREEPFFAHLLIGKIRVENEYYDIGKMCSFGFR